ncbi:helix-turn-helix domain-containing protein [Streptomyces sp. NPDC001492]
MTSHLPARPGVRRIAGHHAGLTALLRALKDRCQLTFSELAARAAHPQDTATVSASTLKRAAGGHTLPQEHVVTAYTRACGATAEEEREALQLRRAARAEQRGILTALQAPAVRSIRTPADFDAALAAAYERAGAPPLRILQERATTDGADGTLLLPLTTLWRITRREARPTTWQQCSAFLRGCGIHRRRMGPWQEAWQRIHTTVRAEQPEPAPGLGTYRAARGSWWSDFRLSVPVAPLTDVAWLRAADHPAAYEPYALADRSGQREAVAAPAINRAYAGLDPTDQYAVLTAGLTHLYAARDRARRNGTAPDTGVDAITVRNDRLAWLQCKHSDNSASGPPTSDKTPAPALPPRPSGPSHRTRQAAPV